MWRLDWFITCIVWVTTGGPAKAQRLIGAVCLTLLTAACGPNNPIAPPNPVAPRVPARPAGPTLTLSGVVAEDGDPVENARVDVSGLQLCSVGCSSRQFNAGSGLTDTAGRYRVVLTRPEDATATFWAIAKKDGYVQQCVASTTTQTDASLDLRLTSLAKLPAAGPRSDPLSRTVSGVVSEATPTGSQPVEGASVGWEGLMDTVLAETRSDVAGRYVLCGLPLGRITGLYALKQGYNNVSYASAEPGTDTVVDISITRR